MIKKKMQKWVDKIYFFNYNFVSSLVNKNKFFMNLL